MDNLHNLTFFDIYEKNALYNGKSCALHWKGMETNYADLFNQTSRFANGLRNQDLKAGTRVAVLCKNHPVFFHLFGAASALNLVLVLINRRLSQDEISHIIEDTTPALIFADKEMEDQANSLASSFSCLKQSYVVDEEDKNFSNLYRTSPLKACEPSSSIDPFLIIHTAAMLGKPRGAVLAQKNIILSNQQIITAFGIDKTKTYLNILPLFHIMGINLGLGILQAGGKNVLQEKFDPPETLDLIQEQKVNFFGSFPPILSNLIDAMENGNYDLSSLEIAAGLEMPDTAKKWETCTDSKYWTMYGQTETSGLISFTEYFTKPGSAGVISPLANIKIADDFDSFLPTGKTGEIIVRGPLVFQGYWNADKLNAHTLRDGWHHTGDLGMIDSDGFLFFKGRKAERELIKPGGENVFPAEVEKVILEHDTVKEVCVFGVPDPKFGEGIKAVCSLNPGAYLTKEDLIKFCGSLIAGYKKPRYVEFVDELPKTENGSIDREKIKKEYG
ncbi:MAG: AMP-binding protein [Desulfobacula sp.]|jgi:long-chain acyl-CoA synthetase|uniref:AMP-binding protein n=1 Tax=Desulfobacula sp. TaxID=2593537 RepID=UPI001DAF09F0|nr:AMP-binding protein [Desulfobacula sp.]MBT3484571.1 AMP-binding protein [Desulfobacula sp.]MBT3803941.1 AMP-binding protein [Desulfobacula sp.]MBT4023556.1 AMP-binding protein [Desulfobacula sp.]MBT4197776.1 AMP-binding protein [Desulfobacula sp.]